MKGLFRRLAWVLWRRRRFGDQSWRMPVLERVIIGGGGPREGPMLVGQGSSRLVFPHLQADGSIGGIAYVDVGARDDGDRVFRITSESLSRYNRDTMAHYAARFAKA